MSYVPSTLEQKYHSCLAWIAPLCMFCVIMPALSSQHVDVDSCGLEPESL